MLNRISFEDVPGAIFVGLGGFTGATARYLVELGVPGSLTATLTVNVLGCLGLGFVIYSGLFQHDLSEAGRVMLTTGFIASFTTYSTFIVDAVTSAPTIAITYIISSYVLGFAAVLLGRFAASRQSTGEHP